jgi:hypothetical protein
VKYALVEKNTKYALDRTYWDKIGLLQGVSEVGKKEPF